MGQLWVMPFSIFRRGDVATRRRSCQFILSTCLDLQEKQKSISERERSDGLTQALYCAASVVLALLMQLCGRRGSCLGRQPQQRAWRRELLRRTGDLGGGSSPGGPDANAGNAQGVVMSRWPQRSTEQRFWSHTRSEGECLMYRKNKNRFHK